MKKILSVLLLLSCSVLPACTHGGNTPSETETADAPADTAAVTESSGTALPLDSAPAETATDTAAIDESLPETTAETPEAEAPAEEIYYVRTPAQPPERTGITYSVYEFRSYDLAVRKASNERVAAMGYAVYSASGEFLFGLYNEYVTNMLFRAKYIVDFARENDYVYGNAATNPGWTFFTYLKRGTLNERVVSCDRLVGWVLYEMGYTDQPRASGLFVWANESNSQHNLMVYLEQHNYERIDNTSDFHAGDIVFVRPTTSSGGTTYGAHVFLCAGSAGGTGLFYRYDHGSDTRIQSVQPSREGIHELFCVYRPTQTTMADVTVNP